jgi:MoaA/NifB/PqqE/SkfB family radical SAM enzyme
MAQPTPTYSRDDFGHSPLLVFYEVTRACDLVCRHCRASAFVNHHPQQLTTAESKALFDDLAQFPKRPMLVLTGGDPMKRPDLEELIAYGVAKGLRIAITPSPTPLMSHSAIAGMRAAGACGFAVSLDGARAETHDRFRGYEGSFSFSLKMIEWAVNVGLPVQVNTTITPETAPELEAMADLLMGLGIQMWSVFFLVPVGRGRHARRLAPPRIRAGF